MLVETATMSDRGQLILPQKIRKAIGAEQHTLFAVTTTTDNMVLLKKLDPLEVFRELRAKSVKLDPAVIDREIHETRAWYRDRH